MVKLEAHPELVRRKKWVDLEAMKPIKKFDEINKMLARENIRLYVDTKTKMFNAAKLKRQFGNLSRIRTPSQLEQISNAVEEYYGKTQTELSLMTGLSEKRELFEFARFIFNSDAFVLLHRAARYTLVKFILSVMIDLACPLGFTAEIGSKDYNPFALKELDAPEYFKLLKGLINGSDIDIE